MIKTIEAKERLVRLQYKDRFSRKLIFNATPTYWCETCDDITTFKLGHRKPFKPPKIEQEFDEKMGLLIAYEQDYCNFHCRICNQQVRCVYDIREFAMSSYHHYPKTIYMYQQEHLMNVA